MEIVVLGHSTCTYCKRAIEHIAIKGHSFTYLDAREEKNAERVTQLRNEGVTSVPQVWINGERIGGFTELREYLR